MERKLYKLEYTFVDGRKEYTTITTLGDESVVMYIMSIVHNDNTVVSIGIYEFSGNTVFPMHRKVAIIYNYK